MNQAPLTYQFYHLRFDKLAELDQKLYGSDPEELRRECDNCGKKLALADCFSVTPIDFTS